MENEFPHDLEMGQTATPVLQLEELVKRTFIDGFQKGQHFNQCIRSMRRDTLNAISESELEKELALRKKSRKANLDSLKI